MPNDGISNNLPIIVEKGKPTQEDSIYRPDIIAYDISGNIRQIWEIESGDGGKQMVGAIFLADACISKHMKDKIQDIKVTPDLVFMIMGNINRARKRIDAIQSYPINAINIKIYTIKEAYESLSK